MWIAVLKSCFMLLACTMKGSGAFHQPWGHPVSLHDHMFPPQTRLLTLSDHAVIAPPSRHRAAAEAERQARALCNKYGIALPNIAEYETMSAFCYPKAVSTDRMVTIVLFHNLLYYIDDAYDRDVEHEFSNDKSELLEVVKNCVLIMCRGINIDTDAPHALYEPCRELYHRFSSGALSEWLQRFEKSLFQHLEATAASIEDTMVDNKIQVDKFIKLRDRDSGMRTTIDLIEYALDTYMPDRVLQDESIQVLIQLTARIGALSNDIFSYEKEVMKLGSKFNFVKVHMEAGKLTFEEAVHESIVFVNRACEEFPTRAANIMSMSDAANKKKYVEGLVDIVNSAYHWQVMTPRYSSPNSPHKLLRKPRVAV